MSCVNDFEWTYEDEEVDGYYLDDTVMDDYTETGLSLDPIAIAGITLIVGLILFGFLNRLTTIVFGGELSKLQNQSNAQATLDQVNLESQFSSQTGKAGDLIWSGDCEVSSQYPDKITRWCGLITQYANKHNLDPDLIAALVWQESGGNELAYSRSGAVGLMQIMPSDGLASSFMCVNGPCFRDRPSSDQLRDPEFNVAFGTKYLAGLIRKSGNVREALKSYGPMDAGYTYSDKVLNIFNRYKGD